MRAAGLDRAEKRLNKEGVAEGSSDTVYPNAEVIKSKNGKPVGEIYQDGNSWGCFHYKADRGYDFIDSREEAIEALKDLHQETGRSRPDYTVKGVAEGSRDRRDPYDRGYHDGQRMGSNSYHNPYSREDEPTEWDEYKSGFNMAQIELQNDLEDNNFSEGVAEGSEQPVSFREMVNVVDQHYPKYYAELSGSDISDKQFERAIVNAYKKIMQKQGMAEDLDELHQEFDMIESIIEQIADQHAIDVDLVWEDLSVLSDDELYVFAVTSELINEDWQKANKRDKTDGMSQKAVNAYRRENPGSKLKTAVTTKPSKLKKGGKASKRRKSYCSRSRGQMKMHSISCSKTPDKAICKARRRWNC